MKIKSQEGSFYETNNLTQKKNQIYCKSVLNRKKLTLLGTYITTHRASEVFAEIYVANNNKQKEFVMPKE